MDNFTERSILDKLDLILDQQHKLKADQLKIINTQELILKELESYKPKKLISRGIHAGKTAQEVIKSHPEYVVFLFNEIIDAPDASKSSADYWLEFFNYDDLKNCKTTVDLKSSKPRNKISDNKNYSNQNIDSRDIPIDAYD